MSIFSNPARRNVLFPQSVCHDQSDLRVTRRISRDRFVLASSYAIIASTCWPTYCRVATQPLRVVHSVLLLSNDPVRHRVGNWEERLRWSSGSASLWNTPHRRVGSRSNACRFQASQVRSIPCAFCASYWFRNVIGPPSIVA
jgi:hypothetical protein